MEQLDSAYDARSVSVAWKSAEVFPATGASRRHFVRECRTHAWEKCPVGRIQTVYVRGLLVNKVDSVSVDLVYSVKGRKYEINTV